MPVIMAGMDHRTVMWRFTGAVLGQGLLHARWCAMSGVMVQTVQQTVWRFHRCCSSSRSSTLLFVGSGSSPWSRLVQQIIEIPLLFVFGGQCPCLQVHFPVLMQRQIPWSRLSVGPFSSPVNTVADVLVVQVVLAIPVVVNDRRARLRLCRILWWSGSYCSSSSSTIPFCYAEDDPHGRRDHGDSTVAVLLLVVDVPVDRLCRFFVPVCVKTVEIPQLRLVFPIRRMLGSTSDTSSCVDYGGWFCS